MPTCHAANVLRMSTEKPLAVALHSPLQKIILKLLVYPWPGHSIQPCLSTGSKRSDKTTYWLSVKVTCPNGNPEVGSRSGAEDKTFEQNSCSSTLEAQGNPNSAQNSTLLQTFLGSDVMRANWSSSRKFFLQFFKSTLSNF